MRVWAPAGGLALAAAAALALVLKPAATDETEGPSARRPDRGNIGHPPLMVAEKSNASEVVQVDFGSNTGTVFEIALADGASTPVVWINED
jgi:hypothetical protein